MAPPSFLSHPPPPSPRTRMYFYTHSLLIFLLPCVSGGCSSIDGKCAWEGSEPNNTTGKKSEPPPIWILKRPMHASSSLKNFVQNGISGIQHPPPPPRPVYNTEQCVMGGRKGKGKGGEGSIFKLLSTSGIDSIEPISYNLSPLSVVIKLWQYHLNVNYSYIRVLRFHCSLFSMGAG